MPELPESVPKGLFVAAIVLALLGFILILFAGGSVPIIGLGMLSVLAAAGIGLKLGLDLWKATE